MLKSCAISELFFIVCIMDSLLTFSWYFVADKIADDVTPSKPVLNFLTFLSKVMPTAKLVPQKDLAELMFRDPRKKKMVCFLQSPYNGLAYIVLMIKHQSGAIILYTEAAYEILRGLSSYVFTRCVSSLMINGSIIMYPFFSCRLCTMWFVMRTKCDWEQLLNS